MSSLSKVPGEEAHLINRLAEKNRQLMQVSTQLQLKMKDHKYKELQVKELETTHSNATYVAIGKMFIECPANEVISDLKEKSKDLEGEIQALSKKQAFLEKSAQEDQTYLRSLISKKA